MQILSRAIAKVWHPPAVLVVWTVIHLIADPYARACGYHDPQTIRIGLLNWAYPNALYVVGAISDAQQVGTLPPVDKERLTARGTMRKAHEDIAYRKTVGALHSLGAGFKKIGFDADRHRVSVVLVETAFWTQFSATGENNLRINVHAEGPQPEDLVIVTGELVVQAIQAGKVTVNQALDLGLVRMYGEPKQKEWFLEDFGVLGQDALPGGKGAKGLLPTLYQGDGNPRTKSSED